MNLFEALKETGFAIRKEHPDHKYFILDNKLMFRNRFGKDEKSLLLVETALDDMWIPYKPPCKHEPSVWRPNQLPYKCFEMKCSYCGVNLKATGWEEV